MSKKNIFLLAAWYVAGWFIASLYSKKKPGELKKELEQSRKEGEGDFKVLIDNFIDTHTVLIDKLKKEVLTDKNKELFNEKKEEVLKIVDVYKKQWTELVEELKTKWADFITEASDNLEKMYEEKIEEIEQLKEVAPEKAKELKDDLKETFDEVKEKITKK